MGSRVAYSSPLLLIALLVCAPVSVAAQEWAVHASGQRARNMAPRFHVAVMGEVVRPGVYEIPHSQIELAELVRRAGGLSGRGSGNMRLVRRGRVGQQVYFTPQSQFVLADGDLVVADPRGFVNHRGLPGRSAHRVIGIEDIQTPSDNRGASTVEIGLVHLIDRPVVLDVPASRATLSGALDMLGNSVVGDAAVTVLHPNGRQEEVPRNAAGAVSLTSGTVLVFDPRNVDVQRLPRLPAVIRPEQNGPPDTGASPEPVAESPATQTFAGPIRSASAGAAPLLPQNAVAASQPGVSEDGETSAFVPRGRPLDAPSRGTRNSAGTDLNSILSVDELPGPSPISEPVSTTSVPEALPMPAPETKSASAPSPGAAMAIPLLVVAGVFVLVLGVLRSMTRQPASPRPPEPVRAERPVANLDDLIENRIPIVDEPPSFPVGFRIHGPAAPQPYPVRADAAHPVSAPHFVETAKPSARPGASRSKARRGAVVPIAGSAGPRQQTAENADAIEQPRSRRPADAAHAEPPPPALGRPAASNGPHRVDRAFYNLHGGRS